MPLFRKEHLNKNSILGIWNVEEDVDWFLSQLDLNKNEQRTFNSIKNELRKKHWLGVRVLLNQISDAKNIKITYNKNGKPILENTDKNISISHSGNYVALILSTNKDIGIDIEKVSPRIERIHHKFLNETEKEYINKNSYKLENLYVIWTAKESLYKLYGNGNIDFIENLSIEEFIFDVKGEIYGHIQMPNFTNKFKMFYERIDEYILMYIY